MLIFFIRTPIYLCKPPNQTLFVKGSLSNCTSLIIIFVLYLSLVPVLQQDLLTFKIISLQLLVVGHQIVIAITYEHLKKQFRKHRRLWHCLSNSSRSDREIWHLNFLVYALLMNTNKCSLCLLTTVTGISFSV
jgi:hypothetical protein